MIRASVGMSYSQNGEDRAVMYYAGPQPGTILDIGAGDGKTFSNSLALIELGWRALLVEPSPRHFAALLELHGANERVTLLNAAVGVDERLVEFFECDDPLYSTTLRSKVDGRAHRRYFVPQVTVSKILAQVGCSADVLSIDTEGSSVDILMQCPLGSWDSRVVIVEHDSRIVELSGWARERGFEVCMVTAENLVLHKVPK